MSESGWLQLAQIAVEIDPDVALKAAAAAAQAKASADYAALLSTVNLAIQAMVTLGLAVIGVWQFQQKTAVQKQAATMEMLEKNTNSIKDELVRVTGVSAKAAGKLEAQEEAAAEKAKEKLNG